MEGSKKQRPLIQVINPFNQYVSDPLQIQNNVTAELTGKALVDINSYTE